jgi:hypothetical protein
MCPLSLAVTSTKALHSYLRVGVPTPTFAHTWNPSDLLPRTPLSLVYFLSYAPIFRPLAFVPSLTAAQLQPLVVLGCSLSAPVWLSEIHSCTRRWNSWQRSGLEVTQRVIVNALTMFQMKSPTLLKPITFGRCQWIQKEYTPANPCNIPVSLA